MEKKVINAKLKDVNGKGNSNLYITGDESELNMPESCVLTNNIHHGKSSKIGEFIKGNPDVGKKSAGFVGVITLAIIIAVVGVIVAFLMLKY